MKWLKYRDAYAREIIKGDKKGEVKLLGWISEKREHKDKIFLMLRDASGYI